MNQPEAFSEFIKAHRAKPSLVRRADVAGKKSIASSAWPEKKSLLGQNLLWAHLATWTFLSISCSCSAWEAGRKHRETGAWSHFKESEASQCWKSLLNISTRASCNCGDRKKQLEQDTEREAKQGQKTVLQKRQRQDPMSPALLAHHTLHLWELCNHLLQEVSFPVETLICYILTEVAEKTLQTRSDF